MSGIVGLLSLDRSGGLPEIASNIARGLAFRARGLMGGPAFVSPAACLWQIGFNPGLKPEDEPALVLDGVIYNRLELSSFLKIDPPTNDAGLALALYEAGGVDFLSRINGDFGLAVFDPRKHELILMRDRFGIKPLYYARVGGDVVFSSGIKAMFSHPGLGPEPDSAALFDFLATHYRYIHRDPARTFYRGVKAVPPAYCVVFNRFGETPRRYWNLSLDPAVTALDSPEAEAALLDLVRDSVKIRLDPDRKMGFSVSSGMDSSSVCSLAANILNAPQDMYAVSYGYSEYDEAGGIAPLAARYGARWENIVLADPPLVETIDRLVRIHDGPLCTVTWLSHFHLMKKAFEDCKDIIFSGLGGDECLAGEYEHFFYFFADLKLKGDEGRLAAEIDNWVRLHDHPVFRKSRAVVEDVFSRLVDFTRPGRIHYDRKRYGAYLSFFEPDFVRQCDRPPDMPCPFDSYLANRCYQDLCLETTPPSLTADEKNAAFFGLSSRFPFLDHRVVEFCFSLKPEIKYDHGVTKAVMRRAMKGILPEANRTNTVKTGFNAPVNAWLTGREQEAVLDILTSDSFKQRGWVKPGAAEELFLAHKSGQANHMMVLWQMLNAELWVLSFKMNGVRGFYDT